MSMVKNYSQLSVRQLFTFEKTNLMLAIWSLSGIYSRRRFNYTSDSHSPIWQRFIGFLLNIKLENLRCSFIFHSFLSIKNVEFGSWSSHSCSFLLWNWWLYSKMEKRFFIWLNIATLPGVPSASLQSPGYRMRRQSLTTKNLRNVSH